MDLVNWLLLDLLVAERMRVQSGPPGRPTRPASSGGVKRALASAFMRLGLRLDPAASERLAGRALTVARTEGRRS